MSKLVVLGGLVVQGCALLSQDLPRWRQVPDLYGRTMPAVAYDAFRDRVVLFGGDSESAQLCSLGDTWEWDGSEWIAREPEHSPSPRSASGMAYDPVRRTVVLYGGFDATTASALGDMWEWDGVDWTMISLTSSPGPMWAPAIGTDPVRREVVLFGGRIGPWGQTSGTDQTWVWNGSAWMQKSPTAVPAARSHASMAWCGNTGRLTMYGGSDRGSGYVADGLTWEWDGTNWLGIPGAPNGGVFSFPHQRAAYQMASMPWRGSVLLHGGYRFGEIRDDMHEWDGRQWSVLDPGGGGANAHTAYGGGCTTDSTRQRVLSVGGRSRDRVTYTGVGAPTWLLGPSMQWQQALHTHSVYPNDYAALGFDAARDDYIIWWEDSYDSRRQLTYRVPAAGHGSAMTEVTGSVNIGWRGWAETCFDPVSGHLLLHGDNPSASGYNRLNDTWLWNGRDWSRHQVGGVPPVGIGPLVYDAARRRILRILKPWSGGYRGFEVWEWTFATGWQQGRNANSPTSGVIASAGFDPASGRILVPLTRSTPPGSGIFSLETWSYDGAGWRLERADPSATWFPQFVGHVEDLGGFIGVMVAEFFASDPHQVHRWDGTSWTRVPIANNPGGERIPNFLPPSPRVFGGHFIHDTNRDRLRLVQQWGPGWHFEDLEVERLRPNSTGPRLGTTWTLDIDDASEAGHAYALALSDSVYPALRIEWRPSIGRWRCLPLGDGPLFQASAAAGLAVGILDGQGQASFSLPIPNDPVLAGYRVHAAAVTFDQQAARIGVVTNAVSAVVVR